MPELDVRLMWLFEDAFIIGSRTTIQDCSAPAFEVPPIANQPFFGISELAQNSSSGSKTAIQAYQIGSGAHLEWRPVCLKTRLATEC